MAEKNRIQTQSLSAFLGLTGLSAVVTTALIALPVEASDWQRWVNRGISAVRSVGNAARSIDGPSDSYYYRNSRRNRDYESAPEPESRHRQPEPPPSDPTPPPAPPPSTRSYYNIDPSSMRPTPRRQSIFAPPPSNGEPPPSYNTPPQSSQRRAYHTGDDTPDAPTGQPVNPYAVVRVNQRQRTRPVQVVRRNPPVRVVPAPTPAPNPTPAPKPPPTPEPEAATFDTAWIAPVFDRVLAKLQK